MDLNESEKLINSLAGRVYRRLRAAGGRLASIEDIRQELWVAMCVARDAYDAEQGVPFGAYAYKGMLLHINRWAERNFERFGGYNYALSLDAPAEASTGENMNDLHMVVPDESAVDPAQAAERQSCYETAMRKLSKPARIFLLILNHQPAPIMAEIRKSRAKLDHARSMGVPYSPVNRLTNAAIFEIMGVSVRRRAQIMQELRKVGERLSR